MITFLVCCAILVGGYLTYGKIVEKIVGHNDAVPTPALRLADGVDYVKLPWWKVFLTQFLNIAGVGPIFGAILGAMFGPVAFIWITFGGLFVGGVHDILAGYVSLKHDGKSISELVGIYLGVHAKQIMRVFSIILLVLVGVVFTMAPAAWLDTQIPWGVGTWIAIIMAYYVIATIVPISTLIARIFPLLSISMVAMCVMLLAALLWNSFTGNITMVEFTLDTIHPAALSPFPFLFVTIACGAVSGFHATKSPMMARCLGKESETKKVFYGAMILESFIALVWAAAAMAILGNTHFWLAEAPISVGALGGPGAVVAYLSDYLLGGWGIILVFIAVVIVPVTSGDTTFRSIRLIFSDIFKMDQGKVKNRILLSIPIFTVAVSLTFIDFDIIWRYFAWSNQTLATMALWTGAAFLIVNKKQHLIASIPAGLLTFVVISYILQAPDEGLGLSALFSNSVGAVVAVFLFTMFLLKGKNIKAPTVIELEKSALNKAPI